MSRRHHRLDGARWERTRRAVFARDGWRCRCCGRSGRLECDHVVPLERDPAQDPYDPANCQTLSRGCHIAKTRREGAERLRRRPVAPAVAAWRHFAAELT
ncbi:MAG: HNH endonuclease [Rhodospirillales bacterium]|nr:HNH endonuclease [Rhodospirillales bacterium]